MYVIFTYLHIGDNVNWLMIHVVGTDDNPMTSCPCHEEACTNIAIHHGYYLSLCAEVWIRASSHFAATTVR